MQQRRSWRKKLRDTVVNHIYRDLALDLNEGMPALSQVSAAHVLHSVCCHADSSASRWQVSKHWWDRLSNGIYSNYSESNCVKSCNSSELYSVFSEWMKGAVAASSPPGPHGGLGRKDETRAPTKLLGGCYAIASQCSRLIFAGNDGSHCELSICVLHAHQNWRNWLWK